MYKRQTFFHYVDAYFKPVTEDDLAWLSSQADDPSPYVFPELGVHYRKIWEKEDAELQSVLQAMEGQAPTQPPWRPAPTSAPDDSPFVPSNTTLDALSDAQMYDPSTRGGPLMELSLIHISEPTRPLYISYAVFCLKKKKIHIS